MSWTTMRPADLASARMGRARWLAARLAAIPGISTDDYFGSRTRRDAALGELMARLRHLPDPAKITLATDKATVAMLGIRSTSTGGLDGALRNWIARVEKDHGTPPVAVQGSGAEGAI